MRCPSCNSLDTQVKDSRPTEDSAVIRRRRVCIACNFRFTTFERVQLRELTVIKRNGRRVPFDRDKLVRSLQISLRKRPVDPSGWRRWSPPSCASSKAAARPNLLGGDRRDRDGASAPARRRRLCPLRLGLPQFPRGQGFRGRARRALRRGGRAARRRSANDLPHPGRPVRAKSQASRKPPTSASCSWRWRSAGAGRAAPGPIPPSARSSSRTASLSAAAGPSRAAARMPSPKRCGAPARPRAAPRSM